MLEYRNISAIGKRLWTLGPTWHDDTMDECGPLHFPSPISGCFGELSADELLLIRKWAEKAIAKTTEFFVIGWDGHIPLLAKHRHIVDVHTSSHSFSWKIDNDDELEKICDQVERGVGLLQIKKSDGGKSVVTNFVPAREIILVEYETIQVDVENV